MDTSHVFIRDVLPRSSSRTAAPVTGRALPLAVVAVAAGAAVPIARALEAQLGVLRDAPVLPPDAAVGAGVLAIGLLLALWYAATGAGLFLTALLRRELAVARWGAPFARRLALGAGLGILAVTPAHADAPDDLSWGAVTVTAGVPADAPAHGPVRGLPTQGAARPADLPVQVAARPADPVPTRPAPAVDEGSTTHVVVAGECLWDIAEAELSSPSARAVAERVAEWVEFNPDLAANPDLIHPGDVLAVPSGGGR